MRFLEYSLSYNEKLIIVQIVFFFSLFTIYVYLLERNLKFVLNGILVEGFNGGRLKNVKNGEKIYLERSTYKRLRSV